MTSLASEAPSAGGAALDEILIGGVIVSVVILAFAWVVFRERQGRTTLVGRLADRISEIDGLPRWVGLPTYLLLASLLTAAFGVWWDVPLHMQNGRDEGPLANPSHYPILFGILGFTHAGILSIGLSRGPMPRHTLRLAKDWHAPMGALVITAAGLIALAGFPSDDLWHRLFGQDVTEWGPTHVMMIGGAVTCILGVPLLLAEAAQIGAPGTQGLRGRLMGAIALSLCIVPVGFLMEFDLGVPQFPGVTQFIIVAFLATWIFTAVRMWFGPGGALLAGGVYLVIHAWCYFTILPLPDVLTARFLLLIPSAVIVEALAAVIKPHLRPLPFVLTSGFAVGTLGMYLEWLWSKVFMPLPQPMAASALPFLLTVATVAALGGGLLATWHVARLRAVADPSSTELPSGPSSEPTSGTPGRGFRWHGLAGVGVFVILMGVFAPPRAGDPATGTVAYDQIEGGTDGTCDGESRCLARVTVQVEPAEAVEDAVWFYALAWQGRGNDEADDDLPKDPESNAPGIMRVELQPTGRAGEYRSATALPLYGNWKTMLRLHRAPTAMDVFPLYAPDDPAIEGPQGRQVIAEDGAVVDSILERKFLQRETREDVPTWLFAVGYSAVIAAWLALLLFFGWCYNTAAGPATRTSRIEQKV